MSNASLPGETSLPALRSCHRCNQKKIRCNKAEPCDNCFKSNSDCIFPGPGRAPRRKKRPLKAELVSRLKGLENEIRNLTKDHGNSPSQNAFPPATSLHDPLPTEISQIEDKQGKLLEKGNSSQYITHKVLLGLESQIGELNELIEASGHDAGDFEGFANGEEEEPLQNGNQFLFGYSSTAISLDAFYPSMAHSQILWRAFEQNVAPVVMIFHKPTLLKIIYKAAANNNHVDRPPEAVVFAVYFAAVNSMDTKQCEEELGQNYSSILQHYRFAAQQALARAGFLQSRSQMVLQAAVLYLTCLRHPQDAHFVWTMTAAVYRFAQGIGLHRDGTNFGLSPFEVEMRRRLWWSIYLLDSQSSEFHAIGPQITEDSYDTKLLLNIDDTDLSPDSTKAPEEHLGFTEMTFCLIRIEMTVLFRRSALKTPASESSGDNNNESQHKLTILEGRLRQLEEIHTRLQERYLQFCDTSTPTQWVTATVVRLALARSWLVIHLTPGNMAGQMGLDEILSEDTKRNQLFSMAIEVLEFAYLLETDPRTIKWSWFFQGYPQWHSVTFVLSELCLRSQTAETDRAWAVIDKVVARWMDKGLQTGGAVMKTVYHLMARAATAHGRVWADSEKRTAGDLWPDAYLGGDE